MLAAVVVSAMAVTACTPKAGGPPTLEDELAAGNLTAAEEILNERIANAKDDAELLRYTFTRDSIQLVRRDFRRDSASVVDYIKRYIPDVTAEKIAEWEASGVIEYKIIDGRKCYFRNAGPNVFNVDPEAIAIKQARSGGGVSSLDSVLLIQIPEITSAPSGQVTAPRRMKIRHEIFLKESGAVVPGDTVRVWIPYPRTDVERQKDVVMVEASEEYFNDPTCPQNTIYFERVISSAEDAARPFFIEYEYTSYGQWFDMSKADVKPYDTESELYKTYTAERPPQIVFSKRIKDLTAKVVGDLTDPYEKLCAIFDYITANHPWASALNYSIIPCIPEYVLDNHKGDCGQVTLLMITMARCAGIPARWQSGLMFHPRNTNMHDWGEVYYEGVGWVPVDTSFGRHNDVLDETGVGEKFFNSGIDSYRMIANSDYSRDFSPSKRYGRNDTVDSQCGEVETQRGMLFNGTDYGYDFSVLEYK